MTFVAAGILLIQLAGAQEAALKVGTAHATAGKEVSSSQQAAAALYSGEQPLPVARRLAPALSVSTSTAEEHAYPIKPLTGTLPDRSDSLAGIRIATPGESQAPFQNGTKPVLESRRLWLSITLAQHSAATFDAWSTRRAITRGHWETDPMLRPFAGSSSIYGAIQVGPLVLDFLGHHMQRSQISWMRRIWWIPQAVSTAGFLYAGSHNLSVTR